MTAREETAVKIPTTHDDPSTLLGAMVTFVGALFGALVVFGVLDAEQAAALGAVLTTALPIVLALAIRRHAWAPDTVATAVELARRDLEDPPNVNARRRAISPVDAVRVRGELSRLDGQGRP